MTLIRGQKLPIFSGSGLSHNKLAVQIVKQARIAEENGQDFAIVFAAMGVQNDVADYFGTTYDKHMRDQHVAVYPEYYATWDNPGELIPFAAKLAWARDNDQQLYNQLARLVVKSNYPYMLNPNSLSNYYSANLSVTKEIGDHVSVSFYANNFFNNMGRVRSSQTGLETSLFDSGYIPSFYYGLSLRLHL